jgi:hypothetical protein
MDASKLVLGICLLIFGGIGSYAPLLFGADSVMSGWAIFWGTIGSFVGIWVWIKLKDYIG